ncbi:response regulator [bacterium]|nr:MAG: response regulator [bacterium]
MSRVLIIDDEEIIRENICELLELNGFETISAVSGQEGLDTADKYIPDLIICDIMMKGMDGYDVLKAVRNNKALKHIPFLFLSAKTGLDNIRSGMTLGADDYLIKPFESDDLIRSVNLRISKHKILVEDSEIKYHILFNQAIEGIIIIDSDANIIKCNNSFAKMMGYSKEELHDSKITDIIHPGDFEDFKSKFEELSGGKSYIHERRLVRKDKSTIYVEVSAVQHSPGLYQGMFRDITERKLQQKALEIAKEKAEAISRLKSTMLSSMSHEFRTPLSAIIGFSDILSSDITDTAQKNLLGEINHAGHRLFKTLTQILALAELESGDYQFEDTKFNISACTEALALEYREKASLKGLTFNIIKNDDELLFRGSEKMFVTALKSILDNAFAYTSSGSVTVNITKRIYKGEPCSAIDVTDTGIGIAKENLDIIFREFRQISEGYGRYFEGSGLGLTIAKKMMENNGGHLLVTSNIGKGSVFTILLPEYKQGKMVIAPNLQLATSSIVPGKESGVTEKKSGTPRLLIVDDNTSLRTVISMYLKDICYTDYALNGNSAVELAMNNTYDLILMDINLGSGMNGIETTNCIKNLDGYKEVPVIAITGYALSGDENNLLREGFDEYLAKPFTREKLIEKIRKFFF